MFQFWKKNTYKWPLVSLIWGWGYIFLAEQLTLTCWPVGKRSCWNVIEEAGAGNKKNWHTYIILEYTYIDNLKCFMENFGKV